MDSTLPPSSNTPLTRVLLAEDHTIVREGLRALRRGRPVLVSDWRYRLLRPLMAVLPDRTLERLGSTPARGSRVPQPARPDDGGGS